MRTFRFIAMILFVCLTVKGMAKYSSSVTNTVRLRQPNLFDWKRAIPFYEPTSQVVIANDCGAGSSITAVLVDFIDGNNTRYHFVDKQSIGPHSIYVFPQYIVGTPSEFISDSFIQAIMGSWGPYCIIQVFQGGSTNFYNDTMVYNFNDIAPGTNNEFFFGCTMPTPNSDANYTVIVLEPQE
jgi:hypothetical protein